MIGPSFESELQAAGLIGLPFSWGPDGVLQFDESMTQQQRDAVMAVLVAHNPSNPAPPTERSILDSVGCFNLAHFKKDMAVLESERIRLGQTQQQAYAANKTYRIFIDALTQLTSIGVEL
ncbi:MAG: hypothetical protein ACOY95_03125 [Pseudomonadota bacterium]